MVVPIPWHLDSVSSGKEVVILWVDERKKKNV